MTEQKKARQIKFRMWDPEEKTMIGGDELAFEEYAPISQLLSQKNIMQYTGFKDKNGREIYEGDILQIKIRDHFTNKVIASGNSAVEFFNSSFGVRWGYSQEFTRFDEFSNTTFEVIGNIYENPELLERRDSKC